MRKGFVAAVLLLALGIFGVIFATNKINETADKVVFTENVIYGDRAYADGLTVLKEVDYAGNLAWKSTVKFTKDTFSYSTEYGREQVETSEEGHLFLYTNQSHNSEGNLYTTHSLDDEVSRLADTVESGDLHTFSINLKDIYEYYPISYSMMYQYMKYGRLLYEKKDKDELKKEEEIQKAFDAFFKIRVLDNDIYSVSVDKLIKGTTSIGVVPDSNGDHYSPYVASCFTDTGIFFGISNRSQNNVIMDFDSVPGGYGIYYLPAQGKEILAAELKMFCPLDSEDYVEQCSVSYDGSELHLITERSGTYFFSSFSIKTGELLQKTSLCPSDRWIDLFEEDNFVVFLNEETLIVFTKNDEGIWQEALWTRAEGIETQNEYLPGSVRGSQYAFDGKRLAVMGPTYLKDRDGQKQWGMQGCGFFINVFDEDGLKFYATYDTSLEDTLGFREYGYTTNGFELNGKFDNISWQ